VVVEVRVRRLGRTIAWQSLRIPSPSRN
jgi:hypothetical protein